MGRYRGFCVAARRTPIGYLDTRGTLPVLAIGGAESVGEAIGDRVKEVADDVQIAVLPAGHWVAEQAPEEMLDALTAFLTPYRDAPVAAHSTVR